MGEQAGMIPDNLKAVLLLDGPGQLQTFVLDVSQKEHHFIDPWFGKITYEIQESSLGPEGWVGVEKKRESPSSSQES